MMAYGDVTAYLGLYAAAICPYVSGGVHVGFGIPDGTYNFQTHNISLHGQNFVALDLEAGSCFSPICTGCIKLPTLHKKLSFDVYITTSPESKTLSPSLD